MKQNKMKGASLEQAMPKHDSDNDYETESAMRTMHEASGIMADKQKLAKVHKLAGRKHKALMGMIEPALKSPKVKSLADLKQKAQDFGKKDDNDGDEL